MRRNAPASRCLDRRRVHKARTGRAVRLHREQLVDHCFFRIHATGVVCFPARVIPNKLQPRRDGHAVTGIQLSHILRVLLRRPNMVFHPSLHPILKRWHTHGSDIAHAVVRTRRLPSRPGKTIHAFLSPLQTQHEPNHPPWQHRPVSSPACQPPKRCADTYEARLLWPSRCPDSS